MANGSFQNFVNNTLGLYCEYSWSQSISGNYSDVTVSVWVKYYSLDINSRNGGKVTVNGTSKSFSTSAISSYPSGGGGVKKLTQQTIRVNHNSDGKKTGVGISVSWPAKVTYSGTYYGTLSASTTINLPTIPRAASITSATNFNDEQNPTISYSNPAGNNVTSLQACISLDGSKDDIAYRDISKTGSSYTFSLTTSERNVLRNATSGNSRTVYFYVRTTIGGTSYYSSLGKTLTIAGDAPTFLSRNVKYADTNSSVTKITHNSLMIVQNKSNLSVTYTAATAKKGASISSYSFTLNGVTKTSTSAGGTINFGTINSQSNLTLSAKAIDSRGLSTTIEKTITCYEYSAPYFVSFNAFRANSDGTANNNGTYMKVTYGVKYSSVNGKNAITVKIYGTGSVVTASGGSALINLNGDTKTSYQVYAIATDSFGGQASSSSNNVFGETRVINITKDGTGVAIGKMAETKEMFECRWDAKFDGAASGPSGFSTSSDKRVKKNIQEINIDIVDNLKPIQYELIQSPDNKIHYGFVAQDVEATLSDAGVNPDEIGIIGHIQNHGKQEYVLTYTEFIPLLTKKCQELQAETNMLKQEIAQLKTTIESLQK